MLETLSESILLSWLPSALGNGTSGQAPRILPHYVWKAAGGLRSIGPARLSPPVYHRTRSADRPAAVQPHHASAPSLWSVEQRCFLLSGGDVTSENQVAIISGTAHPAARSNSLGFVKEQFPGLSLEFILQML